jgi:hypothetical protein
VVADLQPRREGQPAALRAALREHGDAERAAPPLAACDPRELQEASALCVPGALPEPSLPGADDLLRAIVLLGLHQRRPHRRARLQLPRAAASRAWPRSARTPATMTCRPTRSPAACPPAGPASPGRRSIPPRAASTSRAPRRSLLRAGTEAEPPGDRSMDAITWTGSSSASPSCRARGPSSSRPRSRVLGATSARRGPRRSPG